MNKRTYAVDGLLSYNYRLNAGRTWFYVKFEGVRNAGFGSCRAFFTTSDELTVRLLEKSEDFLKGKIYRVV